MSRIVLTARAIVPIVAPGAVAKKLRQTNCFLKDWGLLLI